MSAIAGIYHFTGEPVSAEIGLRLMDEFERFPADRTGTWASEGVFLGCRTRWLTPESVNEELPRKGPHGLAITADAILDNRDALLALFGIEPSRHASVPDSELIVLAYLKWGEASPAWLIGDYAFVIWDESRRRLFGARDHSGKRTLYYHRTAERFAFSTLIGPLLALPGVEKRLNERWLSEFLAITGMVDTADSSQTVYLGIEQIPPGYCFLCEDGRVTLSEYGGRLLPSDTLKLKSDAEYEEAFRDVFGAAVRSRLRSGLPVGSQLSGGLDSGAVASFAALGLREEGRTLHTFSYVPVEGFTDWTPRHLMANEKAFMQATAAHHDNMETHFRDFAGTHPLSVMDFWLGLMEMPYKFFENSYWQKGIFEEASSRGIGFLYNGARGNYTISWGPALDYYSLILKRLQLIRFLRELGAYSRNMGVSRSRVLSVVGAKAFPALQGLTRQAAPKPAEFPMWIHPEFAARTGVFERIAAQGFAVNGQSTLAAADAIEARAKHFTCDSLWNSSGTSFTKLSLRYGVQSYDPTNDLRVIRFCLSLPLDQFVRDGAGRSLVRRSTRGILADEVRLNQRKRGVQAADWLYRIVPVWKEFTDELEAMSKSPLMREYVNMDALRGSIERFKEAPKEESTFDPELRLLMRSLIVYRFLRNHFEGR
ncbi:asparagine synthase-related protein [Gorillibacterium timonense]|uniref:asparagine synthase-related protein n=1 Tax=Gorillibacterium timonense TaxID=1689269 RepID=UPI00071CF1DD|nr:asparagine synthase-related protein [Gorillibacterium timonense]